MNYQPNSIVERKDPQKVFVYGTLKKGYPNHDRFLKDMKFLGQGVLEGIMFHIGGFPAINLAEPFSKILGEVYLVDWEDILSMDELEGVSYGHYRRVEVDIYPYRKVWTYVYDSHKAIKQKYIIPNGVWEGPTTSKLVWAGWNKGVMVGHFSTSNDEIRVGPAGSAVNSAFRLYKDQIHGKFNLVDSKTGRVLNTFTTLGSILRDIAPKKTLSLQNRQQQDTSVSDAVIDTITKSASNPASYSPVERQTPALLPSPSRTIGDTSFVKEVPKGPQAARLLGIDVSEA